MDDRDGDDRDGNDRDGGEGRDAERDPDEGGGPDADGASTRETGQGDGHGRGPERGRRSADGAERDRDRELADAIDELVGSLQELRRELHEPPSGPLGLPRPPTPRELLRFTEQHTIPTVIALLETSIRALELLSAAIRLADGRPLEAVGGDDGRVSGRIGRGGLGVAGDVDPRAHADRLATVSRRSLETLEGALEELQTAISAGSPQDPELRRVLEEARALREEVDDRLEAATRAEGRDRDGEFRDDGTVDADDSITVDIDDGNGEPERGDSGDDRGGDSDGVDIDVDEELESIKRELDERGERSAPPDASDDRDGRDEGEGSDGTDSSDEE